MVPRPEMPLRVTRGSTTQNFASSTRRLATRFDIFAVTSTPSESFASSTFVTWPIFTSLYLTSVFPASIPSATFKRMVMVGPSVRIRSTAIPTAITAARMRSEEHTSELQSHSDLVCRLLLEKKKGRNGDDEELQSGTEWDT